MKVGDRVKLIGIPPDVTDDHELQTRSLFQKCLGQYFVISEIETVEGLSYPLAKLNVGQMVGGSSELHAIWVEERYLQVENPA